jgi:hypothetical protein
MKRNPRRSYDAEGREIPLMPLSNSGGMASGQ